MDIHVNELQAQWLKELIEERKDVNQKKEKALKLLTRSLITKDEFIDMLDQLVKRQHTLENRITYIIMNNL